MSSLVTRCPACGTLFKVVPDQLRISEGWVRCGQCDEVFDAQAQMQTPMAVAPSAGPSPMTQSEQPRSATVVPTPAPEAPAPEAPATGRAAAPPPVPETSPPQERASQRAGSEDFSTSLPPDDTDFPSEPSPLAAGPDEAPALESLPPEGDGWAGEAWVEPTDGPDIRQEVEDAPIKPKPSFLQTAAPRRDSRVARWARRTAVAVLALALVGQVTLQQRERLAASAPSLVPILETLCVWRGCEVGPLRQIESVVIESSSFVKVKADVYRLSFSIKNTAQVPVALPYAELSLTDLRDQSVLRRVVAPSDYGARAVSLAPGEELGLVVPVAVKAASGVADKVTGYRLLVFYP